MNIRGHPGPFFNFGRLWKGARGTAQTDSERSDSMMDNPIRPRPPHDSERVLPAPVSRNGVALCPYAGSFTVVGSKEPFSKPPARRCAEAGDGWQGATTSRIEAKYGEEERRRQPSPDSSNARARF